MKHYLLLPQLKIQNANAMSSTCTIGFPAMTAWLGAVHALERKLKGAGFPDLHFTGTAVSCHACELQVYRGPGDWKNSVIGAAKPLQKKGAKFVTPPFIEEPRIHLTVSLLLEIDGIEKTEAGHFLNTVARWLPSTKWAAGDLMHFGAPAFLSSSLDRPDDREILYRLMPGYVLVERRDLLEESMSEGQEGLDALLQALSIHHRSRRDKDGQAIGWDAARSGPGWIIPIAVGFKGLTPLGRTANQRDPRPLHRFAEPVLTLGEFRLPIRFHFVDEILWHYEYLDDDALYLCRNQKSEEY